jgi:hypothetical protein
MVANGNNDYQTDATWHDDAFETFETNGDLLNTPLMFFGK